MRKEIGELIRRERKREGVTQAQLARMVGVSRTTITKYETGASVPHDVLMKIIEELRSPVLRLEVMGGAISCQYLENVDLSPLATQQKAIEEMEEALQSLRNLNLVNKIGPEDLTEKEKEKILKETMMELQDVNVCMDLILISLTQKYDIDLKELEKLSKTKMKNQGYTNNLDLAAGVV